jgi:acyl-CoA synthetase (AMP-forming)/AMP-acid ligase II
MSGENKLFRCIKSGKIIRFSPQWNNPVEIIEQSARCKPGRPAIISFIGDNRRITRTYCQLIRRILALTQSFTTLNAEERLGILCGSHASSIEAVLSSLTSRRKFVIIDPLRKPFDHQIYKLTHSKCSTLIIPELEEMSDMLIDRVNEIHASFPSLKIKSIGPNPLAESNLLSNVPEGFKPSDITFSSDSWNDPVALIYSSGRHGLPKGFCYTPHAICANCHSVANWLNLSNKSKFLAALDIDCLDGLIPILSALLAGGTAVIHAGLDGGNFWNIVSDVDADMVRVKPNLIEELLAKPKPTATVMNSLKYIITGSGYLPRQIGLRFLENFDIPMLQCYGTTETGGYVLGMASNLSRREYELALRDNLAGQELSYCNVRIKPSDSDVQTSQTTSGEGMMQVRGHTVSSGFWDGSTVHFWSEPWLCAQDMAVSTNASEPPTYQIRGRLEDTLVLNNQRFWPEYIERSMLDTFSFLKDCVALSYSDKNSRTKLCALVVLADGLPGNRRSELIAQIEARLKAGGVAGLNDKCTPDEIVALHSREVPRLFDGHPDRTELHRMIATQTSHQGLAAS